jgi:YHS domain-containing protein
MFRPLTILSVVITFSAALTIGCSKKETSARTEQPATARMQMHHEGAGQEHGMSMQGETKELAAQTTCPVMGGAINKSLYVDHDGKRIYVCCEACVGEVKKDPQKYINKLREMGQAPQIL